MHTCTNPDFSATAQCVFIIVDESDSRASCGDLYNTCVDLGLPPEGTRGKKSVPVSTLHNGKFSMGASPSWIFQYCPRRVPNPAKLCEYPECCLHPTIRPADMDWLSCLVKYYYSSADACPGSAPNPETGIPGKEHQVVKIFR